MKLIKTLKRIGLIGLTALAFNFAANTYINGLIHKKRTTLKTQISQIKQVNFKSPQLDPKLGNILKELEYLPKPDYNPLNPFWNQYSILNIVDDNLKQLPLILKKYGKRHVDIGYASEGQNKENFISALNQANLSLVKYGISLDIKETIDVKIPKSFDINNFPYGIKHSFDNPYDYYFVWTTSDYSNGKNDYAAKALTKQRVSLIDDDFPKEHLDKLITQEILRLFTGAKDTTVQNEKDKTYFTQIDEEGVTKNLTKISRDADYQLDINLKKHRTVTINVGLDGISQQYAQELLSSVSQIYTKEFNISFHPIGFYDHKLPNSWKFHKEMKRLKGVASKQSDIYILLTNYNWDDDKTGSDYSLEGGANSSYGYLWAETQGDIERVISTITHEIGHLFKAKHIYRKNAIMHPISSKNSNQVFWTPHNKEIILKNKFMNW